MQCWSTSDFKPGMPVSRPESGSEMYKYKTITDRAAARLQGAWVGPAVKPQLYSSSQRKGRAGHHFQLSSQELLSVKELTLDCASWTLTLPDELLQEPCAQAWQLWWLRPCIICLSLLLTGKNTRQKGECYGPASATLLFSVNSSKTEAKEKNCWIQNQCML